MTLRMTGLQKIDALAQKQWQEDMRAAMYAYARGIGPNCRRLWMKRIWKAFYRGHRVWMREMLGGKMK